MASKIPVAEQFYSIQGEGPHAGVPAVFLRLAGCNLLCGDPDEWQEVSQEEMEMSDDASWLCDTIEVWRDPSETYEPAELLSDWRERGFLDSIRDGAHIILTGGEPTLTRRQQQLMPFLDLLEDEVGNPFVEVETNGTVKPIEEFEEYVNTFNVSLKLSNSGMDADRRLVEESLSHYADGGNALSIVRFKFVVSSEEDIAEIENIVDEYDIPDMFISLMPAGSSKEQLEETYPKVAEICKERGWYFSPRLHVNIWDKATGV